LTVVVLSWITREFATSLLQAVSPSGWKWVVHLSPIKTQTGFSFSKDLAIHAAKRAIEKALKEAEGKK
jgi:hypothetical protein